MSSPLAREYAPINVDDYGSERSCAIFTSRAIPILEAEAFPTRAVAESPSGSARSFSHASTATGSTETRSARDNVPGVRAVRSG